MLRLQRSLGSSAITPSKNRMSLSTTTNLLTKIAAEDGLSLIVFNVIETKLLCLREIDPTIIASVAKNDLFLVFLNLCYDSGSNNLDIVDYIKSVIL